jgi:hypothetical protein
MRNSAISFKVLEMTPENPDKSQIDQFDFNYRNRGTEKKDLGDAESTQEDREKPEFA